MADTAAHTYGGVEYTDYLPTGHQLTCEDVIDFLSQFPADTVITWFLRGESWQHATSRRASWDRTDNVGLYAAHDLDATYWQEPARPMIVTGFAPAVE